MKILTGFLFVIIVFHTNSLFALEKIRITNGEWPPYLSEKLPHYGYASHLVQEAFAAVDIEVEYGFFPWKRSFKYAKDGKHNNEVWHGSVVWVHTKERAQDFLYTDVVITDIEVLFHLKSVPLNWNTVDDLKGKYIGGTLHTVYPIFEQAEKQGILHIERAGNYNILFQRLLKRRIDAVPQVRNVGNFFLRTSLSSLERSQITFSPTVIQERKYHLMLTRKIERNKQLIKLFNEGLKKIKENSKYDVLFESLNQGVYDTPLK
ncbi:MAG: transporter substrate-binding domain-containing protein [SAR324 cluster bacterium]|nr:transporter substrate-binding domain-containing protein [SAR324 cluster bacterium]